MSDNLHNHGFVSGDICNRNKCQGIIKEAYTNLSCSCHINPPCAKCTEDRHYCPECDWSADDDYQIKLNGYLIDVDSKTHNYNSYKQRELDLTKIDWHDKSHTHFSMIKEGVYPVGVTKSQVLEKVQGTFGGRFEYFGNGKFKYIAYTD